MMRFKPAAFLALALALVAAAPALAARTVELRRDIAAHGGQVTLSDVFENAGDAGAVVVASGGAPGGALVLDAGQVRMLAQAHGLDWANVRGIRRLIARNDAVFATAAVAAVSTNDVAAPQVIRKDDMVAVAYEAEGVRLVLQARAMSAAAVGETLNVVNAGSKKIIQAVATGPGQAVVGPQADRLRQAMQSDPRFLASLR